MILLQNVVLVLIINHCSTMWEMQNEMINRVRYYDDYVK